MLAFSSRSKNVQNVNQMALKWLLSEKLQELPSGKGFAPCPYLSNLAFFNCSKNVQNIIQMALKWLLFSEKL